MRFLLGFSPCPNDTFIFDALVNKKIDTEGFDFDVMLEDVETLNRWALEERPDICKISYGVFNKVEKNYFLLNAGGALGKGVGPLLIARKDKERLLPNLFEEVPRLTIALPGEHTTAHLLFNLAFPETKTKVFRIFSSIENDVLNGEADCGVIIHENRFTYQQKGLIKLLDLGEYWEQKTKMPIPLGGIVIRKKYGIEVSKKINDLIRKSLEYGFSNYPLLSDYVKSNAQEMNEDIMRKHIELYVNEYSLDIGNNGRKAIELLISGF